MAMSRTRVSERFMRLSVVLVVLLSSPVLGSAQTGQSPEALAKALQARYQSVRDFTADFVQIYRGGVLRTETRESGTVAVKKPGRMRWTYTSPERKEFVSDGLKMYAYIPEDKQVTVSNVPADSEAPTPVLFLAGKGDLVKDFTAEKAAESRSRDGCAEADAPPERAGVRVSDRGAGPRNPPDPGADDQGPPGWRIDPQVRKPEGKQGHIR